MGSALFIYSLFIICSDGLIICSFYLRIGNYSTSANTVSTSVRIMSDDQELPFAVVIVLFCMILETFYINAELRLETRPGLSSCLRLLFNQMELRKRVGFLESPCPLLNVNFAVIEACVKCGGLLANILRKSPSKVPSS